MSLYTEEKVNSYSPDYQYQPSVSPLAGGGYVVVWTSRAQDGSNDGIYAQRYDASGIPVGPEFRVNSSTSGYQVEGQVTGLSDGSFVVLWTDQSGLDGSSYGIYMQRYSALGVALGGQQRVNATTSSQQELPTVAAYDGGFVTAWASYSQDGSGWGIYAQRYANDGSAVGAEFRVNSTTSGEQYEPEVAALADGRFVVVWRDNSQDGSSYGVYAQRYNADGTAAGSEFRVNTATSGAQYEPAVAMLEGGGFVVTWRSDNQDGSGAGVYAQRYAADGSALGGEFRVNESINGSQYQPEVTALAGGGFAVTWRNDNYDVSGTGSYQDVYVREYDAAGAALGGQVKVNTPTPTQTSQYEPAIASLGAGNYVVVWRSDNQEADGGYSGIYQQLFGDPAELPRQANPELNELGGTLVFGENTVNAAPQLLDAVVSLHDADSADFDGGRVEIFYTRFGSAEDQLGVRDEGTGVGQIGVSGSTVSFNDGSGAVAIGTITGGTNGAGLVIELNANASIDAVEQLLQNLTYANTSNSPQAERNIAVRVYDGDGGASTASELRIQVVREEDGAARVWAEEVVNTWTASTQEWPSTATLADGSYVVVWVSSGQDGSSGGIYGQRFANNGEALGGEFRVNTLGNGDQSWPQITALSDGGFVVSWQDSAGNDGSGWGNFAQRFDAAGNAQGGQFVVNTTTSSTQYHANVAGYDGGFAAVWSNGSDIYLQRFDNAGSKLGGETLVSTIPGSASAQSGAQYVPDVAAWTDGRFVVVWTDAGANDGSGDGVFARIYTPGSGFGTSFLVNTTTTGNQSYNGYGEYVANVAVLADGGFVVVWPSSDTDGSGWGVYGQRFDATGNKVGGEFRVNETTTGSQYMSEVTALSSGGFVVAFYNDNYDVSGSGTTSDVYIREYDAAGNAVDGQRKLVSPDNSTAYQPVVADLGSGNFAVIYSSYATSANGGNNTHEIRQQLFGDAAELARSASPQLADFTGTVSFVENDVNTALQVIDAAVGLSDPDSANFSGGRLDLFYLQGGSAEDQLGVVHQGDGAGQIGVAGNTVSYGGVAIGTISGGADGANLRIDFTSTAATVEAVEALIQRLGYGNDDQNPNASRTLGLRVSDGDGGTSNPNMLTITVSSSVDGAPRVWAEEVVNTWTANAQEWPATATLADGSYVVAWQSNGGQDGSGWGIFAQRFASNGEAIGPEFRVNTLVGGDQSWAQIAALSDGGFVISWQDSAGNDGSGWGSFAQRFDAAGNAQGGQLLLNTTTSGTQYHTNVAAYTDGFAAVWSNGSDIVLQRFDNAGGKLGGETLVSTAVGSASAQSGAQYLPDIAATANGDLMIVWADGGGNDGSSHGVFGRLYDADTATFGSSFLVTTTTASYQGSASDENHAPTVSTLTGGGFVVVWSSYDQESASTWGVYGQRFDAAGGKVGGEFQVNETTAGSQYMAEVTALSSGGFVVAFYNDNYDVSGTGTQNDVYIREYDAAGNAIDGQRKLESPDNGTAYRPVVADLGSGNFAVIYSSYATSANGGNNTHEIRQQLFGDAAELARSASPQVGDFTGTVNFIEDEVNAGLQLIDAAVGLSDADSADFAGGRLDLYHIRGGSAEDQLGVVHEGNNAGQIGVDGSTVRYGGAAIGTISGGADGANLRIDFTSAAATVEAVEALIERLGYANTDVSPNASRTLGLRVSDGDGASSDARMLTITVSPSLDGAPRVWAEEVVNTYTPSTQEWPAAVALADGSYVVAWASYGQDAASTWGIYAQRFANNGEALGAEFRVNTLVNGEQSWPQIAALSDGGFVVSWQDNGGNDGSGWGSYAQRFDAAGVAQGGQLLLNTTTSGTQYHTNVAAYPGGFAAVWSNGSDIYLQRFDNAGAKQGVETLVSTAPGSASAQSGGQFVPDVAGRADGDLVIVWADSGANDGSSNGVFGRIYDAGTDTFGSTFLVNTTTDNQQSAGNNGDHAPNVAVLADGGFVVVWSAYDQDSASTWGVYGQRFDAAGVKVGGEFRVNETTAGGQYQAEVTALSTGGFVVSFYNDNYDESGAGTQNDVYIREYDAAGNAIDGQRKLESPDNSTAAEPAVADLGNGNFVVVYSGYASSANGGNNTNEIRQQLFGDAAELARPSADPVLDDLRGTLTLSYDNASPFYAGTARTLDAAVLVRDVDSADFDGGSLIVQFLDGSPTSHANETLGFAAAGPITVSGNELSYGGSVIGTFSGGAAGANLVVSFDADATAEAVQALVQSLTYVNAAPGSSQTDRYLGFRLFDGDGGASAAQQMLVRIQASVSPATVDLQDLESAVTLAESAAEAGVVLDPGVQLAYNGATGFNAGSLTVSYVSSSGRVDDQLSIRDEGSGAGQVGVSGSDVSYGGTLIGTIAAADNGVNGDQLVINFNASATAAAIERVLENLSYRTSSDGPLAARTIQVVVRDGAGVASSASQMVINVTPEIDGASPLFDEQQANTYEADYQITPVVTGLQGANAGGYVVVWRSDGAQDGSSYGVYGQRYDAKGAALGAEFQVNTYTQSSQYEPELASLANGGFVVVWRSSGQDGSGESVHAQIYGADGLPVGGEFQVNTTTVYSQYEPAVVGLSDGSFVVAYRSDYTDASASYAQDVLAKRYAADGTLLADEFTLNTTVSGTQFNPRLAALPGGKFVAVYGDASSNDGSGYGVFSKVFNADGSVAVAEQVVPTTVAGNQYGHDVAVLADGGYVVVWWSSADDQIHGQRFDAAGAKSGGQFQVSTADSVPFQDYARVAALADGGFVVAWDSYTNPAGSYTYDVLLQQFDAAGNKVDGPIVANANTASTQYLPDIAGLTGSNFVVAWASYDQEAGSANSYGVFTRMFGEPGTVTRSAAPELADLVASVSYAENAVNAAPQLIDAAVRLSDADSANFAGGQLVAAVIPAGQNQAVYQLAQDQLGIRNQGTDPGQIGVSGNTVSYGGVAIGTLVSNGANGADLVVSLNASATPQAVEALIENLTYANSSTDPAASRLVSIRVNDGAGGASAAHTVQITVTPELDGASRLFGEQQVNSYEADQQTTPAVSSLQGPNAGGYVVVWRSDGAQDGSSYGVFGQRYDAKGAAVGAEFQVNSQSLDAQYEPAIASLPDGGFVVAWRSDSQDGSSAGIYAQRYGADGAAMGGEFQVNTSTASNQYEPAVVGLTDGSFVVAYRSDYTAATSNYPYDVLAQRYAADGSPLGGEFTLNTTTASTQFNPRLAALADGKFVAVYGDTSGADGSGYGVFAKVFNADGSVAVAEQVVPSTVAGNQYGHDVAVLSDGGFVVVWWSADDLIYAQRFDAAGAKVGGQIQVSTVESSSYQDYARVAALDNGGFVVAWDTGNLPGGSSQDVVVQQFDAAGNKVDGATLVNTTIASTQYMPDIAGLAGGNFVVTWAGYNQESATPNTYGVFSQILGTPGSIVRSAAPELVDVATGVRFDENVVNATPQLIDGAVRLSDADSANFAGGQLVVSVLSGYGNIQQAQLVQEAQTQDAFGIRHQGSAAGQVGVSGTTVSYGGVAIGTVTSDGQDGRDLVVAFNASATAQAVEAVIENLTYANSVSNPVATRTVSIQVSDGAGGASAPRLVTIEVTPDYDGARPLFEEEVVNTWTPNGQSQPAMARLADGGYVTVWTSQGQDGWGYGVYGQRYDAQGVAVGNQFQVNDYTPYDQVEPAIASLSGGGFVVVWTDRGSADGSGYGVFGQRYDADGLQVGEAFLVNASTSSNQYQPTVASLGGGFVVAWRSDGYQDGRYYDVFLQRFDANGQPLGAETRANTSSGLENNYQYEPAITVLADGSFVVTWRSDGNSDGDGGYAGVFGQRFAADGSALGAEFQINTYTPYYQYEPSIAALADGGFVVAWTSYYQDGGSTTGVFAQRYDADGTPVGDEFRVNTTTNANEEQPSVAGLDNGGYVIAWAAGGEIWLQQYDAAGLPVDGQTRVDVKDANWAQTPVVLALANGNFVVSWTDYRDDTDANTYGIFQRVFGDPADFSRQANPELVDVAESVTFRENAVNLAPQLIDAGVGLVDVDSANFDGGRLEVDYISGYGGQDQLGMEGLENQDQLGIRSEGDGPTQVRVSGLNVYYSGVLIGTIVADGSNHGKLVVAFNADATVPAVESVIENLTYQNTSSNPFVSRTISIRVTDGDGGASDAKFVTINVTPEVDGAVPLGLEHEVNTTVAGQQTNPAIAHLADGGYVVVWTDEGGADGSSYGVYGQRYDAGDNAVGGEFRVNTTTTGAQYEPQVVGLSGGGFAVVWRSDNQDGSGAGVYAQVFDGLGAAVGGETLVNTMTTSNQYQPDVAASADGGFVVAWYHDYYSASNAEYADIFFQRLDASGAKIGAETRANPPLGSTFVYQSEPSIAWLEDGGFVVVWTDSSGTDGNGYGVFGQRFDASGNAVGTAFRANTYTDGSQHEPDVAALDDGGWIAVWRSEGQDLSSAGVYAQRYAADGTTVGAEFRVNTTTSSNQYEPVVTGLANGGWVVSWTDAYGAANTYDVFLQQYDAAGRQVDGETLVNSYVPSVQQQPAITAMADGGFVVAWSSYVYSSDGNGDGLPDGGNDTYEIRLQRFSNTAPQISPFTVNGQEEAVIVLDAQLFIDSFSDAEGQNLAAIRITTLPAEGTLKVDGVAVFPGQEVSLAELQAGKLSYQGDVDYFGLDQFAWTGSDGVAYAPNPVFSIINLANVNDAPALQAGADDTAAEGTWFSHAITLGDPDPDTHLITVDWGDGSAPTQYSTSEAVFNIWHYFPDDGSYTVTVTADDQAGQGNSVETDSFQVVVSNVVPDLWLSGDATVEQDQPYTLTLGNVSDPGDDTVSEYRIDWGDGSAVEVIAAGDLPANRELVHTYTSTGDRTISVSLVDEDGTHANVETRAVQVSAPAEVLTVNAGADLTVNEGQFFVPSISFADPTDTDPAGRLYTIDWGDGNTSSGRTFNPSALGVGHTYADGDATYTVTVTVDDDGAQSGSDSFEVTVNNVAPTLNLTGGGSVAEGALYTLAISHSDPGADTIASYTIDWGDGGPAQAVTAAALAAAGGSVTHVYADGAAGGTARTITVSATDEDGTWTQTKALTVDNVAPTIALTGNLTVDEGSTFTLNLGAVTDPGQDTPTSYTINWGDGAVEVVSSLGDYTHVYADGTTNRTITVLVTDEDGQHANAGTHTVTVNNVAPSVALTGAEQTGEGASYELALVGSDPAGTADTLSYSIDWGDGSPAQVLSAVELGALGGNVEHVFTDDEDGLANATDRTITVTVSDEDGGSSTTTKTVTVNNVAPVAAVSGAATVAEAASYTLSVGAVVDPGTDSVSGYSIDWGDGSVVSFTPAEWAVAAGSFSHVYGDGGLGGTPVQITVRATDEDGEHVLGTQAVTVENAAPSAVLGGADASDEGASYVLSLAGSDPAGGADTLSYSIDWGDGSSVQVLSAAELDALGGNVAHVFADDEDGPVNASDRTITVTVSDEDGGSSTTTKTVTVNNVAPTIDATGATTATAGLAYTLDLSNYFDPGADTLLADGIEVDWGDGTVTQVGTPGELNHTYASAGTPTIRVSLTDEDGRFADVATIALTVAAPADTVTIAGQAPGAVAEGETFTRNIVFTDGEDSGGDGWSYDVLWNDGVLQSGTTTSPGFVLSRAAADGAATLQATITVTDTSGADSDTEELVLEVANVAPVAAVSGAATVVEATSYALSVGAVVDPGTDSVSGYSIDWGDGSVVSFTPAEWAVAAGSFSHVYGDGGLGGTPLQITVRATDEDGEHVLGTQAVTVENAAPSAVLGGADASDEGASYVLSLAGSDPAGGADTLSYSIDWGDGSPVQVLSAVELGALGGNVAHVFTDDEDGLANATDRTITVTVSDEDGGSSTTTKTVTVNNVAPVAAVSGAATVAEAASYTLSVGAVVDPGTDSVSGYSIDWGDGSVDSFTPAEWAVAAGSFSHVYGDGGLGGTPLQITVRATDEDGEHVLGTQAVTVENAAPSAVLGGADASDEGASYVLSLAGSDPAGGADTLSYSIDWGDGSSVQVLSAAELDALGGNVAHVFADDEDGPVNASDRTITVTVSDEDGGSSTTTKSVTVNNVAPTIALAGAPTVVEDVGYTLTLGAVTDPGTDTVVEYVVDWGDGNVESYAATGDVSHVFADPGVYQISVALSDEDGLHAAAGSLPVTVTAGGGGNTPPTVQDETYTVHAGDVLVVSAAAGLLANDSDADGDALLVLNYTPPANGVMNLLTDGSFTYTPDAGFVGSEVLTYTVSDGTDTRTGTVTLVVENEAPTVQDETYTVHAGDVLVVSAAAGLLANDSGRRRRCAAGAELHAARERRHEPAHRRQLHLHAGCGLRGQRGADLYGERWHHHAHRHGDACGRERGAGGAG
ncbi:MAG: cadherin-like domain-containing protein [Thauera sp.]|nr:PKD domain-containing protein [Thauera sp.]MCP5224097.1 cadherin-like domain-containing protein [Thauera sp.]